MENDHRDVKPEKPVAELDDREIVNELADPVTEDARAYVFRHIWNNRPLEVVYAKRPDITPELAAECMAQVEAAAQFVDSPATAARDLYTKRLEVMQEERDQEYTRRDVASIGQLCGSALEKFGGFIPAEIRGHRREQIAVALMSQKNFFEQMQDDLVHTAMVRRYGDDYVSRFLGHWAVALANSPLFASVAVQSMTAPITMFVFHKKSELTGNQLLNTDVVQAKPYRLATNTDRSSEARGLDRFAFEIADYAARDVFSSMDFGAKEVHTYEVGRHGDLGFAVNRASEALQKSGQGPAAWILTNPKNVGFFPEGDVKLTAPLVQDGRPEVRLVGELVDEQGRRAETGERVGGALDGVKVIVDPALPSDKIVVGAFGPTQRDVRALWMPYVVCFGVQYYGEDQTTISLNCAHARDVVGAALVRNEFGEEEFARRIAKISAEERVAYEALIAADRFELNLRVRYAKKVIAPEGAVTIKVTRS